jgi:hypothetical protein
MPARRFTQSAEENDVTLCGELLTWLYPFPALDFATAHMFEQCSTCKRRALGSMF